MIGTKVTTPACGANIAIQPFILHTPHPKVGSLSHETEGKMVFTPAAMLSVVRFTLSGTNLRLSDVVR